MRTVKATALRRSLFQTLLELARTREPVEIVRLGKVVAQLSPVAAGPGAARKPPIDLDAIAAFCRAHQVRRFSLFGSILRNDFAAQSDVDVLLDMGKRRHGYDEHCAMNAELESMFGRKVDLADEHLIRSPGTHPRIRRNILASRKVIYEAS